VSTFFVQHSELSTGYSEVGPELCDTAKIESCYITYFIRAIA